MAKGISPKSLLWQPVSKTPIMKIRTENIFQVIEFDAAPDVIYAIYIDSESHSAFTHLKAFIEPVEGGRFVACNGRNMGINLVLKENERIVQAWRHKEFPDGHYSIVDIMLEPTEDGKTRIQFNQIGVPVNHDGWLTEGWNKVYWEPLKAYLEERKSKKSAKSKA
jgi:activator of HSP90 ATPase